MLTEVAYGLYVVCDDVRSVCVYNGGSEDKVKQGYPGKPHVILRTRENCWTWTFDTMDDAHAHARKMTGKINRVATDGGSVEQEV